MKSCLVFLVLIPAFCCAKGKNGTTAPLVSPTAILPSSSKNTSNSSIISRNSSITISPSLSSTTGPISPNVTVTMIKPNHTQTVYPNNTQTIHSNVSSVNWTSTPIPSNTTVVSPAPSPSKSMEPTTTPKPSKAAGKDDKDYDNMKKRMWIAASFAIVLALTTIILGYLVYRQRRINRELSGDPASSRLL